MGERIIIINSGEIVCGVDNDNGADDVYVSS